METWATMISTLGFPIVSFLLCGGALKYVYDRERKSLDDTIAKIGDLTAAVNHNSETINDLVISINNRMEERHEVYRSSEKNSNC